MSKIDEIVKYEVEDALRTLIKAQEIQGDKKLLQEVQKLAKSQKKAISSIAALKESRDEVIEKEDGPAKTKFPNEKPDPELEENTYIKRVEKIKEQSEKPDAELVRIDESCPHCGEEEE